jgi:thiamine pyrophosphokinase
MTMEDLDTLTRKLLSKIREIKIDIWTNSDKTKEDVEKALNITDQIYAELYNLKLRIEKQEVLR